MLSPPFNITTCENKLKGKAGFVSYREQKPRFRIDDRNRSMKGRAIGPTDGWLVEQLECSRMLCSQAVEFRSLDAESGDGRMT